VVDPCIPVAWQGFSVTLRYRGAVWEISVRNPDGVSRGVVAVQLDEAPQPVSNRQARLKIGADRGTHAVLVTLGAAPPD